jgi:hypothetical protein
MESEIFLADPDSEYNDGAMLEEYKGVFSLVSANEAKDGTVYKKWGFPQKDKKPIAQAIPWKVRLGSKEQAVTTLKFFLDQLTNAEIEEPGGSTEKDDIPF